MSSTIPVTPPPAPYAPAPTIASVSAQVAALQGAVDKLSAKLDLLSAAEVARSRQLDTLTRAAINVQQAVGPR